METEQNAVECFPSLSCGYNGSFPQGAEWIQTRSDSKTTPSQPPLHFCLCLHPLLCSHAPSLSPASSLVVFTVFLPAPKVLNMSECLGERSEPESQTRAQGTRMGRWLSPLHVRVKTQGEGCRYANFSTCLGFWRLTWPPLPSAGSGLGPQKQAGGRLGWAPLKASTERHVCIAAA